MPTLKSFKKATRDGNYWVTGGGLDWGGGNIRENGFIVTPSIKRKTERKHQNADNHQTLFSSVFSSIFFYK